MLRLCRNVWIRKNKRVWRSSWLPTRKEVQKRRPSLPPPLKKSYYPSTGIWRVSFWNTIKKTDTEPCTNWNLQFAAIEAADNSSLAPRQLLDPVSQLQNSEPQFWGSETPTLRSYLASCDSHDVGHWRRHYVVAGLEVMKWCRCGLGNSLMDTVCSGGIRKLVDRYKKCVEVQGYYTGGNRTVAYISLSFWLVNGYWTCFYFYLYNPGTEFLFAAMRL